MNYNNLKCSELKDLLAKRGLPSHGKKNELLERLMKHEEEERAKAAEKTISKSSTAEDTLRKILDSKNVDMAGKKETHGNKRKSETSEESETKKRKETLLDNVESFHKQHPNIVPTEKDKVSTNNYYTSDKQNSTNKNEASNNPSLMERQNKQETENKMHSVKEKEKETEKEKGKEKDKEKEKEKENKMGISGSTSIKDDSVYTPNTTEKHTVTIGANSGLTEKEKMELRKKRFGIVTKDEVLESRARRFSIMTKKMENEIKKKRAERFGLNIGNMNDPEMKRRRAERFSLCPEIQASRMDERKVRFNLS